MKHKNTKDKIMVAGVQVLTFAMVGGMALYAHHTNTEDDLSYLVVGKGDNKIVFQDIDSRHATREMSFDGEFADYYTNVQIGDTLRGTYMNHDLSVHSYNIKLLPTRHIPKITKINGSAADQVIHARIRTAQRDSIMQRKQSKSK